MEFQAGGDSDVARQALGKAVAQNHFVPEYLLDPDERGDQIDYVHPGSEEDGMASAAEIAAAWHATPGALEWLEGRVKAVRAEKRAARWQRLKRKAGKRRR
jgi:hypothetical protein